MDSFISKPIAVKSLRSCLEQWFTLGNGHVAGAGRRDPSLPLDPERLRDLADDRNEENNLLQLFLKQSEINIGEMAEAAARQDRDAWRNAAHRMRGAAANLGVEKIALLCQQAEGATSIATVATSSVLPALVQALKTVESWHKDHYA